MSLSLALSIASSGLRNINAQLGLVSNNVANANTPDYSVETAGQQSLVAGTQPLGVQTEAASRSINSALQQAAFQQDAVVAGLTTTTASLQQLDALQGTPGQGNDLGSLLGKVRSGFTALLGDPSSAAQQAAVVAAASNLTRAINTLSDGYTQQRQAAQNDIVTQVSNINANLNQIGILSNRIVATQHTGLSVANLENQRDAVVHALGNIVSIKTLTQPNGDLIVTTASGTELPTRGITNPVQTTSSTIGAGASYASGSIPAITLNGIDITNQLQGGSLGADIALRDSTLPTFQAELDEFSHSLASQFSAQGLTLFSDPTGNVSAGGGAQVQSTYVGFASAIQVNPAVAATPSLVRDGTQNIAGSPTGASAFTTNPSGGPAGFTTLINRILNFALGSDAQTGVPQPASNTTGLGPDGTSSAPYSAQPTLAANVAALVADQAGVSNAASERLSSEQTLLTTLNANVTAVSGVNMDTQMSFMLELENAYGANARIISTVQSMFTQLLQMVQ